MFEDINSNLFLIINNLNINNPLNPVLIVLAKYLPILFIIYLIFNYIKGKKQIVFLAVISLILGMLLNQIIHIMYFHPRPNNISLGHTLFEHEGTSFPSDHTTFMLSISILLLFFPETYYDGITLTIIGLFGGLLRVYCGIHFPFDILGSIIVSLISAILVFKCRRKLGINQANTP